MDDTQDELDLSRSLGEAPPSARKNTRVLSLTSQRPRSTTMHDEEAFQAIIGTLKAQIGALVQRNSDLVHEMADADATYGLLKNEHAKTCAELDTCKQTINDLTDERDAHLNALNSGKLVERQVILDEMTRIMENAADEEGQRKNMQGQLDDLSSLLFEEANKLVAVERIERHKAETLRDNADRQLLDAEDALRVLQIQLGSLVDSQGQLKTDKKIDTPKAAKFDVNSTLREIKTDHVQFQLFLDFLAHARRNGAIHELDLNHAFLKRSQEEDLDPCLRLDLAPGLGLFTRSKISQAIMDGTLVIEPCNTADLHPGTTCAITGKLLTSPSTSTSYAAALFGRRGTKSLINSPSTSQDAKFESNLAGAPIHVFYVSNPQLSTSPITQKYPLDPKTALHQLRAACEFWRYVRNLYVDCVTGRGRLAPPPTSATGLIQPVVPEPINKNAPSTLGLWASLGAGRRTQSGSVVPTKSTILSPSDLAVSSEVKSELTKSPSMPKLTLPAAEGDDMTVESDEIPASPHKKSASEAHSYDQKDRPLPVIPILTEQDETPPVAVDMHDDSPTLTPIISISANNLDWEKARWQEVIKLKTDLFNLRLYGEA